MITCEKVIFHFITTSHASILSSCSSLITLHCVWLVIQKKILSGGDLIQSHKELTGRTERLAHITHLSSALCNCSQLALGIDRSTDSKSS